MLYATSSAISPRHRNAHATGFPRLHGMYSGTGDSGFSTGTGSCAEAAACGEFVERYVFRWCLSPDRRVPLAAFENADPRVLAELVRAFRPHVTEAELREKAFETCRVLSLPDCTTTEIPLGLVSLGESDDRAYFEGADSTACAVHRTLEQSVLASALELAERQCAMAAWLGPWPAERIVRVQESVDVHERAVLELCDRHGSVELLSISSFDCYCVLAAFRSRSDEDGRVNFAVGFGTSLSPRLALKKALFELYQLFDHTLSVSQGRYADERVKVRNTVDSWRRVHTTVRSEIPAREYFARPASTADRLMSSICAIAETLWLYSTPLSLKGCDLFATKLLSPDLFVSCLGLHANWYNRFATLNSLESSRAAREPSPFF